MSQAIPTFTSIVDVCAKAFGVSTDDVIGKSPTATVSAARRWAMWITRHTQRRSLTVLACLFSVRSHTTIMSALDVVDASRATPVGSAIRALLSDALGIDPVRSGEFVKWQMGRRQGGFDSTDIRARLDAGDRVFDIATSRRSTMEAVVVAATWGMPSTAVDSHALLFRALSEIGDPDSITSRFGRHPQEAYP